MQACGRQLSLASITPYARVGGAAALGSGRAGPLPGLERATLCACGTPCLLRCACCLRSRLATSCAPSPAAPGSHNPRPQLFDYYCQSQLVTVKVSTGEVTTIGPTRLYTATSASPDGRFLLVSWLDRPYSYSLPCGRFPKKVQLWTR